MLRHLKYIFISALLISLGSCHKGEITLLTSQVSSHTTYELYDIAFTGDSTGYICGGSKYAIGIVIRTYDGGKTWSASDSFSNSAVNTMNFFSPIEALLGTFYGFTEYTDDSAHTFAARQISTDLPVNKLSFYGRQHGVAVCGIAYKNGSVYNTSDGGNSWAKTYNDSLHALNGAAYIDDTTVIVCGYGTVLRSANSGSTYKVVRENGDFYQAVKYINGTCYAVGYQGEIIRSTDRGVTWQIVSPANGFFGSPSYLLGLDFIDESHGYAVGESGLMLHTADGGKSWQTVRPFTSERLRAVHMFSATSGIVAGGNGKVYLFQQ